jgi:hypothetical protein
LYTKTAVGTQIKLKDHKRKKSVRKGKEKNKEKEMYLKSSDLKAKKSKKEKKDKKDEKL